MCHWKLEHPFNAIVLNFPSPLCHCRQKTLTDGHFSSLMCHRFNFFIPYMPLPSLSFWRQWHRGDEKFKTMALKGCSNFQWHIGDELHFSVAYRELTPNEKCPAALCKVASCSFVFSHCSLCPRAHFQSPWDVPAAVARQRHSPRFLHPAKTWAITMHPVWNFS